MMMMASAVAKKVREKSVPLGSVVQSALKPIMAKCSLKCRQFETYLGHFGLRCELFETHISCVS